jgi:hypothetical protein
VGGVDCLSVMSTVDFDLLEFIDLANISLDDFDPYGRPDAEDEASRREIIDKYKAATERFRKGALRGVALLPRNLVGGEQLSFWGFHDTIRNTFEKIVSAGQSSGIGNISIDLPFGSYVELKIPLGTHIIESEVDALGRLCQQFIRSLIGRDAARIRECPICFRIFWARRSDQPCCSARCNNLRRQKKFWRDKTLPQRAAILMRRKMRSEEAK